MEKESIERGTLLATSALLFSVAASVIYNLQMFRGQSAPNAASWAVWAFVSILNFTSYRSMSKDRVMSLLPTLNSLGCILTFFVSVWAGRLAALSYYDTIALALGILSGLVWWRTKSAVKAQLILQLSIFIGFIPTYLSIWNKTGNEPLLCWILWFAVFIMQAVVVGLRWKGQKMDLLYPVDMAILHLIVVIMLIGALGKEVIGETSGFIILLSAVPYDIRVWQRKITPPLTTWVLWSLLSFALFLTYKSSGATANAWPARLGVLNPMVITWILIYRNEHFEWPKPREWTCAILCIISLAMWFYMNNDKNLMQYALYVAIGADAFGAVPTIFDYVEYPMHDRPFMWLLFGLGYGVGMFAIKDHTLANYALPVYMLVVCILISIPLIVYRIRKKVSVIEWI